MPHTTQVTETKTGAFYACRRLVDLDAFVGRNTLHDRIRHPNVQLFRHLIGQKYKSVDIPIEGNIKRLSSNGTLTLDILLQVNEHTLYPCLRGLLVF